MNIFLLGIKVILILLEFIYKNGKLGKTSTSIDEESSGQGDMEMGIQQPSGEEQIVYHHNPMINSENSEEKQPLLRRMDDVEHKTESMKEEMKAKTESMKEEMKAKTESMKEEMKAKTESMKEEIEGRDEGQDQPP